MKKILIIMLFITLIILSSCSPDRTVRSEEDKLKYHEHFKSLDEIEEYNKVECIIIYMIDSIKYIYSYRCYYNEDGSIVVKNYVSQNNQCLVYTYNEGTLLIQEYDDDDKNATLISEREEKIDKETFLAIYEKKELSKFNVNLQDSKYHRIGEFGMSHTWWTHYFKYDKKDTFNYELLGKKVSLKNYYIEYSTGKEENIFENDIIINIYGIEDNKDYRIYIHIDKERK